MKVLQGLDSRGPPSAASLVPKDRRTQRKAAYRLWSHMHSRTTNKIYPLGGLHAALQAGTWLYGRRGSDIGWQAGASPLGDCPQMKPHNRQRRTRERN